MGRFTFDNYCSRNSQLLLTLHLRQRQRPMLKMQRKAEFLGLLTPLTLI
jgi:hypothetical protein